MITQGDKYLEAAFKRLEVISQDEEKRLEYTARQKALYDHNTLMEENYTKGRAEGLVEGEAKGLEKGRAEGVLRNVLSQLKPYLSKDVAIICATKGIENETLMPMSDVIESTLGEWTHYQSTYLSGPSFALDVAHGRATSVSLASYNANLCHDLQVLVSNENFRAYTTHDVLGVELGGSLKNVIAIAAGAVAGLDIGHNAAAAIVTRGLAEMTRLCVKLGGEALTLSGLSGLGDLVLTCYGELSRNRDLGFRLGRGESLDDIQRSRVTVAEGVKTARSAYALAKKFDVDMPIVQKVYEGIYEAKSPEDVVRELMARQLKQELEFRNLG